MEKDCSAGLVGATLGRPPKNVVFWMFRRDITFFRLAATDFPMENPRATKGRPYVFCIEKRLLRFATAFWGSDVVHGVDRGTVIEDGEVQMGTGASAGGAHVADELALLHGIALVDHGAGHVGIQAGIAVAMVDGDVVAVGAAVGVHGDLAAAGGVDGGTLVIGQIHAVVELVLAGGGVDAVAVGRGQLSPGAGSCPALAGDEAAAAGIAGAAVVSAGVAGTAVVTAGVAGAAGALVGFLLLLLFFLFLTLALFLFLALALLLLAAGFLLGLQGLGVLHLSGGDLGGELGLLGLPVCLHGIQGPLVLIQLRQQLVGLGALLVQDRLGRLQLGTGILQSQLLALQGGAGLSDGLGGLAQLHQPVVLVPGDDNEVTID